MDFVFILTKESSWKMIKNNVFNFEQVISIVQETKLCFHYSSNCVL